MATLLFYQEPVALNREEHKNLRLKKQDNVDFAKNVNSVPVAGFEFFEASRELPVLFTKDGSGDFIPVALLSLSAEDNNLGEQWGDVYMPAFIRRYPFALSSDGTVIFDKQAPHLQEEEGERLFNEENGENTETLDSVAKFLNYMDQQYKATHAFSKACAERELLEPFNVQVNVTEDKPVRLSSLYVINEKKLNELADADVTEFFRNGWLAWAYAHLHSLNAVGRVARRDREAAAAKVETKD
jgi:hypothetical protein